MFTADLSWKVLVYVAVVIMRLSVTVKRCREMSAWEWADMGLNVWRGLKQGEESLEM